MSYDRTGEPVDLDDHDPATCPKWLGEDDEGRPIPCLRCKTHLATGSHIPDYRADRPVSDRARAAIERENHRNA